MLIVFSDYTIGQTKNKTFDRLSFKKSYKLKGKKVDLKMGADPVDYAMINDSLLLINMKVIDSLGVSVYNLKTQQILGGFDRRGDGPNETSNLQTELLHRSNYQKEFYLLDEAKRKVSIYNIDSLLQLKDRYSPLRCSIPFQTKECVSFGSDKMVCYNPNFLDDKEFNNHEPCLLLIDKKKERFPFKRVKYATVNVTGGEIIVSPTNDRIWVFHQCINRIDIYNQNLELLNSLIGPERSDVSYELGAFGGIVFKDYKFFESYLSAFATENAVYAVFTGKNNVPYREYVNPKPVEVFKFSWDGELLSRYQLDRYVCNFSVDNEGKHLYGVVKNKSMGDRPELYQYKLR